MPSYKGILASSTDPTGQTLSLTIESGSKVLIGIIGWFAVSKGMDAATAQTQLQAIIDLTAQSVPMVFTFWNTMLTGYGLVRKLFSYFKNPASVAPVVVVPVPPIPAPAQQ
jgi:hypothetical protein